MQSKTDLRGFKIESHRNYENLIRLLRNTKRFKLTQRYDNKPRVTFIIIYNKVVLRTILKKKTLFDKERIKHQTNAKTLDKNRKIIYFLKLTTLVKVESFSRNCTMQYASCFKK